MKRTTRYECDGIMLYVEPDDYENGCDPFNAQTIPIDMRFSGETAEDVIAQLCDFCDVPDDGDAVDRDSCDETGRVDLCCMNTNDNTTATASDLERFKAGTLPLWYACYTAHIYKVTREPVTLREAATA